MLEGKKIVLGITGSIAAYKACLIIRGLIKRGAEVQVVITPAGKEFITPLTLSTLTHKPVISEFFDRRDGSWNSHVELGLWADAMVIAPATASTIGKMAHGIADNMLITTYLSMKAPVFVAPAMDLDMYAHPSTQDNLSKLKEYGNIIIEPGTGFLASQLEGKGRMEEPESIIEVLDNFFEGKRYVKQELEQLEEYARQYQLAAERDDRGEMAKLENAKKAFAPHYPLYGEHILVTAGPTHERIDPVRYIGNDSSGKMGLALAEECADRGAEVTLVCGPTNLSTSNPRINRINVESAQEMYDAATKAFLHCKAAILCAAVADFTPAEASDTKIKREELVESGVDNGQLVLRLEPTKDIAKALGQMKTSQQLLVGFALETNDEVSHAKEKLKKKNLDFIVMNSLRDEGAGFMCDTNKITIINEVGSTEFPLKSKKEVAKDIVNELVNQKNDMVPF